MQTSVGAGVDCRAAIPWYFPSAEAYAARLEAHGFAVDQIDLIPRPTPLPTDMAGWLDTFGESFFGWLPTAQRSAARDEVLDLLRPCLCDERGRWTADYVRLRLLPILTGETAADTVTAMREIGQISRPGQTMSLPRCASEVA